MTKLHFNYKDVFRSLRLAFSAKKLAITMWGLFLAILGYIAMSYVALLSAGWSFADTWQTYRVFPIPDALAWYGWIIWALGVIYALIVILITGTAVSKVIIEQLRGDDFFQITKAFQYATQRMKNILLSPLLLVLFIITIVIAGLILSLLGAIPYFGEIFTGIMIIPAFAASLFIVYLFIVLFFTILYAPVVIGATGNDTFDTLFEVFSMLNLEPARLVWYTMLAAFLSKAGAFLIAFFSRIAVNICANVLSVFMGTKMLVLMDNAASGFRLTIPYWCPEPCAILWDRTLGMIANPGIFYPPAYQPGGVAMTLGSVIMMLAYYGLILFVLAFGMTVFYAGACNAYLVIAKKKDDNELLLTKEAVANETTVEPLGEDKKA